MFDEPEWSLSQVDVIPTTSACCTARCQVFGLAATHGGDKVFPIVAGHQSTSSRGGLIDGPAGPVHAGVGFVRFRKLAQITSAFPGYRGSSGLDAKKTRADGTLPAGRPVLTKE